MRERINFVVYNGKRMYLKEALELATYPGKSINMVYTARDKFDLSLQDAFEYVVSKYKKMQAVKRRTDDYRRIAKISGKSIVTIRYRINMGFSDEEIISPDNLTHYRCGKKNILYVMYKGQKRKLTEAILEATQGISNRTHILSTIRKSKRYKGLSLQESFDKYVSYIVKKWKLKVE